MAIHSKLVGLLLLASVPAAALASVGPGAIDDTMALMQSSTAPKSVSAHDCEGTNVLRRLSGCSELISSGDVSGSELAHAYRNRGMALFSLGEKRRAIQDFDKAIDVGGGNAALYLARGTAWQHLGEHARALDDLVRAVELEPDNAAAWGNLGVAWEELGDDERALDAYDRSLDLEPDNAVVLNNRGNVLARMGKRQKAIRDYNRALRLRPDYASAYYNRAGERCLEGEAGPAVADYLDAIRLGERQRAALQDFLSSQGYYQAASDPAAGADIESALRRWSESACTPAGTESVRSEEGEDRVAAHPGEGAL
ncbi:MAG TPA: tetratricopeptide repeat protein [Paracoccaceae bacterium]|nr:tetratricopeptide repeat protein [Paracoccaceae bacterium]